MWRRVYLKGKIAVFRPRTRAL